MIRNVEQLNLMVIAKKLKRDRASRILDDHRESCDYCKAGNQVGIYCLKGYLFEQDYVRASKELRNFN